MEVKGTIKVVGTTQEVGSNGFTKRQLVVTTDEQYPQDIAIDFVKDKCSILDKYGVGQQVTVGVNLRGSEYNGKYYVNLQGWKINAADEVAKAATAAPAAEDDLPW
jgi:hypothetical protein